MMTSTRIDSHLHSPFAFHAGTLLPGFLSVALFLLAVPAWAQAVQPTSTGQLKQQQQRQQLQTQLHQQINQTASQAFKSQPKVQQQMYHALQVRQQQSDARQRARVSELGSPQLQQQQQRHQSRVAVQRQIRHTANQVFKNRHKVSAQTHQAQAVVHALKGNNASGHKHARQPPASHTRPAAASSSHSP